MIVFAPLREINHSLRESKRNAIHKIRQHGDGCLAHLRHCVRDGIEKGNADETIEAFAEALENFSKMA